METDSLKERLNDASEQLRKAVDDYPPAWDHRPLFDQVFASVSRFVEGDSSHDDIVSRKIKDVVASLKENDDPDGRLSSLLLAGADLFDAVKAAWNHVRWVKAQIHPPGWLREFEQCLERFYGNMREFRGPRNRGAPPRICNRTPMM